jgi:hypothetical protein
MKPLPCGGGVEYFHRDPASRRRWRKRKSHIWDSKIWSRVPRVSDPRKTALARASSIYKRQTRPHVRGDAPQKQDRKCQTVKNIWSWAPDGGLDTKTYWLTGRQSQCDLAEWVQLRDMRRTVTTWAREAEESPLLEAFARERLLKTAGWEKT